VFDPKSPDYNRRWTRWRRSIDLDAYASRFDRLEASGTSPHGEADAVARLLPDGGSVLDAGCGMGRIALELGRQGFDVVGIDIDPEMLAHAEEHRPDMRWEVADITSVDLGRTFHLVLLAGNVMIFVVDGTEAAVVANMARHVTSGGCLVAGFSLGGVPAHGISLADYDAACAAADLSLAERWATWEGDPYDGGDYAVSVHRRGHSPNAESRTKRQYVAGFSEISGRKEGRYYWAGGDGRTVRSSSSTSVRMASATPMTALSTPA